MSNFAPRLPELQRALRRSLIEGNDADVLSCIVGDGLDPAARVDIYRNTCSSVLTAALRLSFAAVARLVGADFFDATARIYIRHDPSRCACLDDWGSDFGVFLEAFEPARSVAYLPDVARLEWAVSRALHAQDAPALGGERLASIAVMSGSDAAFVPHPSISLMRSAYPVDAIWRAVLEEDDAAMRSIDSGSGAVCLLIERTEAGINVQRMTEDAWQFTKRLCSGEALHEALECAKEFDAAALLADHLTKGRFVDVRVDANEMQ